MRARPVTLVALLGVLVAVLSVVWLALRPEPDESRTEAAAENAPREAPSNTSGERRESHAEEARQPPEASSEPSASETSFVFQGRVLDARSSLGLAGARVEARFPDGEAFQETTCDGQGAYYLELVVATPAQVEIAARAEGYCAAHSAAQPTTGAEREAELDFRLDPAFRLVGRVLGARTRQPIARARVRVFQRHAAFAAAWDEAVSDAEGRFSIGPLVGLSRSELEVSVVAREWQTLRRTELALARGADELELELLLEQPLRVTGRVVVAGTGEPLGGAEVELVARDEEFELDGAALTVGPDGRFELVLGDLPAEDAALHVTAEGRLAELCADLAKQRVGDELALGDIALRPALRLSGRAREEGTLAPLGEGTARLRVLGLPEAIADGLEDQVELSADGSFELAVESCPAGAACELIVEATGCLPWTELFPNGCVDAAEDGRILQAELERSLALRGRLVLAEDQSPIAFVRVRLDVPDRRGTRPVDRTNAEGEFELQLSPRLARGALFVVEWSGERFACGTLELGPLPSLEQERELALVLDEARRARLERERLADLEED